MGYCISYLYFCEGEFCNFLSTPNSLAKFQQWFGYNYKFTSVLGILTTFENFPVFISFGNINSKQLHQPNKDKVSFD